MGVAREIQFRRRGKPTFFELGNLVVRNFDPAFPGNLPRFFTNPLLKFIITAQFDTAQFDIRPPAFHGRRRLRGNETQVIPEQQICLAFR